MVNKVVIFFKRVGRNWFLIFIIAVIFVFFIYREIAILLVAVALILYFLSYIPNIFFKSFLTGILSEYFMVEDDTVAHIMRKPIKEIREELFKLSQNQSKKPYLIVFHENRYIYFHPKTIVKFIELYKKGFGEREILDGIKEFDIEKKSEVKAIMTNLKALDRLPEREVSVKEYRDSESYK